MTTAADINLTARLESGADHIPQTMKSYATYLKKFAKFAGTNDYVLNGPMISITFFTDELIAKFLVSLGDEFDSKPHALKSARAALSYGLKIHALEDLNDFKHLYPFTHRVIEVTLIKFEAIVSNIYNYII
jgi:hypothetical protein